MPAWRSIVGAVLLTSASLAASPFPTSAQSLAGALEWLPPGSLSVEALSTRPAEDLDGGAAQSFFVEYGRLAFRSPDILGGTARKAGISCQACHSNGHADTAFFVPGLSDRPGRVDVSHAFWNLRNEDGRLNPLTIPSLRGAAAKERFGVRRQVASLREFTRRVIVVEFSGEEPSPLLLDGLIAYIEKLQPTGRTERPILLEDELADAARYLKTLALPLAEEDAPLAMQIVQMIRGQLGFIHERFVDAGPGRSRVTLENWSRQLARIGDLAEDGRWPEARSMLTDLQDAVKAPPPAFAAEVAMSLYNPARLQEWLSKPVR